MLITSKQLMLRTGASYRQIDYWCSNGIISPINSASPGSGTLRKFDSEIVPKVEVLVYVSRALVHTGSILQRISDNYEEGSITFGNGISLSWNDM